MLFKRRDKKKEKIAIDVFVVVSLMVFLALGIINYLLTGSLRPFSGSIGIEPGQIADLADQAGDKNRDPYITRNPDLGDLLTGPILNPEDPSMGDKYAKVNIFLFSDFTCDFCAAQEQTLKKIFENYRNDIKIYWKDYPEHDPESVSFQAAVAGQCANRQGAFWPFHDYLYENNDQLGEEKYLEIAKILKLDEGEFRKCWTDRATAADVLEDIDEADMLGISGIPFLYIGSQEIMGEASYEEIERLIKIEMKK